MKTYPASTAVKTIHNGVTSNISITGRTGHKTVIHGVFFGDLSNGTLITITDSASTQHLFIATAIPTVTNLNFPGGIIIPEGLDVTIAYVGDANITVLAS